MAQAILVAPSLVIFDCLNPKISWWRSKPHRQEDTERPSFQIHDDGALCFDMSRKRKNRKMSCNELFYLPWEHDSKRKLARLNFLKEACSYNGILKYNEYLPNAVCREQPRSYFWKIFLERQIGNPFVAALYDEFGTSEKGKSYEVTSILPLPIVEMRRLLPEGYTWTKGDVCKLVFILQPENQDIRLGGDKRKTTWQARTMKLHGLQAKIWLTTDNKRNSKAVKNQTQVNGLENEMKRKEDIELILVNVSLPERKFPSLIFVNVYAVAYSESVILDRDNKLRSAANVIAHDMLAESTSTWQRPERSPVLLTAAASTSTESQHWSLRLLQTTLEILKKEGLDSHLPMGLSLLLDYLESSQKGKSKLSTPRAHLQYCFPPSLKLSPHARNEFVSFLQALLVETPESIPIRPKANEAKKVKKVKKVKKEEEKATREEGEK